MDQVVATVYDFNTSDVVGQDEGSHVVDGASITVRCSTVANIRSVIAPHGFGGSLVFIIDAVVELQKKATCGRPLEVTAREFCSAAAGTH